MNRGRYNFRMHRVCPILILAVVPLTLHAESPSTIRSNERVVFFPTAASLSADGTLWTVPVHVHVFEPTESETLQNASPHRSKPS